MQKKILKKIVKDDNAKFPELSALQAEIADALKAYAHPETPEQKQFLSGIKEISRTCNVLDKAFNRQEAIVHERMDKIGDLTMAIFAAFRILPDLKTIEREQFFSRIKKISKKCDGVDRIVMRQARADIKAIKEPCKVAKMKVMRLILKASALEKKCTAEQQKTLRQALKSASTEGTP